MQSWLLIGTLALAHCLTFADRILLALLAPPIKAALGLSDFELGLLLGGAFVAAYVMASVVLAPLADRRPRTGLIALSLLVTGAGTMACGLAAGFASLLVARLVLGVGQSLLSPAALSLIAQHLPRAGMGRGIALYTAGATLGRSLALTGGAAALFVLPATLGSWAGGIEAWRAVFLLFVGPVILLALVFFLVKEPRRPPPRADVATGAALNAWFARHRSFYVTHTLTAACCVLVIQTVTAWTTTLLARRHGLSVADTGAAFGGIILVTAPLGHLAGGWTLDRLGRGLGPRAPGLLMAAGLLVAVPLTAIVGAAPSLAVTLAGLAGLTFVLGAVSPAGFVGLNLVTPDRLRGRATGLFLACVTAIGFGLGPPSLGLLTDHVFGTSGIGTALIFVVATSTFVGMAAYASQTRAHLPMPQTLGGIG